ncbi:MAG TPA: type II toxin-antitoxin system ParD family antitoxin [Tepidisphaeraceae bacterium]|nr:type II toxin-antitoxin system ParD family antitoxin [Tepidisphaeraceae bacterium]
MPALHQLNVSLTPELDRFVRGRVETGQYATSSEVVREALRLLQQRDRETETAMQALREKLSRAVEQADRGEFVDGERVFAHLDEIIERHRAKRTRG